MDDTGAGRLSAQAWRTALDPAGEWVSRVLEAADKRLTEVRRGMPDAGGLVIAGDHEDARAYAALLRGLTGKRPVVVLSDDFGGPWVQVDGRAEVLDLPEAIESLVDYYRSISGEHPDWDEYRQAMVQQGKSLLRITPVRWGPVATGGFPARLA